MSNSSGGAFLPGDGAVITGAWQFLFDPVQPSFSATRVLTAADSGQTFLFDRPDGMTYTLPKPEIGLHFGFIVTVSNTSHTNEIDVDAATTFLLGTVLVTSITDGATHAAVADGTAHVKLAGNGTTTGGLKGSQLWVRAVSGSIWHVFGFWNASGSLVTPFESADPPATPRPKTQTPAAYDPHGPRRR
jgi:hypothetical protein